jgi:hypothetical protein
MPEQWKKICEKQINKVLDHLNNTHGLNRVEPLSRIFFFRNEVLISLITNTLSVARQIVSLY